MKRLTVLGIGLAGALGALGCGADDAEPRPAKAQRLKAFSSCDALVRYARRHGSRTFGPRGVTPRTPAPVLAPEGGDERRDSAAGQDFSTTNVQEAGVDEPDIVKTDGKRLFAIAGGKLHAMAVDTGAPRPLGSLQLPGGGEHQLLVQGDRALVISGGGVVPVDDVVEAPIAPQPQGTVLTEVDVRDPAAMRVIRTLTVDGLYVSARQTGPTARVVLSSAPDFAGEAIDRRAVRRAGLSTWLPSAVLERRGVKSHRRLVRCGAVRRPQAFSGLGMLTVLTIDMEKGLPAIDADALMTDAQTVYASDKSLYVATERWIGAVSPERRPPTGMSTAIHAFDASQRGKTAYRASGRVPGFLLNQWSMSEHAGHLRVASTTAPVWWQGAQHEESESFVTVLAQRGGRLAEMGKVGGLGRGERIHAVRFIGDAGYVVTFRQVDPLYTLDLADPARPRVLGELKILGYSAYLHPVGENLLLGVGQDATPEGRTRGTQLSLFDVSNLKAPTRLHAVGLGSGSSSEAEFDHHAFLYWPATRLAVLPVNVSGASGFSLDRAAGIREVGRIAHGPDAQIRRSLVVGDRVYTVSEQGVKASRLDNLADVGWAPFPG